MRLLPSSAGPVDADALRELSRLRPGVFAAHLAFDWLLIGVGVGIFGYFAGPVSFLIGSVLVGCGQHGLAVLGHDAIHYRICHDKRWNDLIGNLLCLLPVGMSISGYRAVHFAHHRDTYGPTDPELPLRRALGKNFRPPYTLRRAARLWLESMLGRSLRELVVFGQALPRPQPAELILLAGLAVGTGLGSFYLMPLLVPLWLFSLSTTFISRIRVGGWFEHGIQGADGNRYDVSRSWARLLLPHKVWLHYEHHRYPSVPFYHLEQLRRLEAGAKIYSLDEMIEELKDAELPSFEEEKAA